MVLGAAFGAVVMWGLVHPSPDVSGDGDAVAFHPNERYTEVFDAFPGFAVSGENRSNESLHATCLAPRTAEQDVVFAVVNTGEYALAWYACLNEGIVRE